MELSHLVIRFDLGWGRVDELDHVLEMSELLFIFLGMKRVKEPFLSVSLELDELLKHGWINLIVRVVAHLRSGSLGAGEKLIDVELLGGGLKLATLDADLVQLAVRVRDLFVSIRSWLLGDSLLLLVIAIRIFGSILLLLLLHHLGDHFLKHMLRLDGITDGVLEALVGDIFAWAEVVFVDTCPLGILIRHVRKDLEAELDAGSRPICFGVKALIDQIVGKTVSDFDGCLLLQLLVVPGWSDVLLLWFERHQVKRFKILIIK